MLKKILVAITAGIILAALLLPALAGNTVLVRNVVKEKAQATAMTDLHPVRLTK